MTFHTDSWYYKMGLLAIAVLVSMAVACAPSDESLNGQAELLPTAEPLATPTLVPTSVAETIVEDVPDETTAQPIETEASEEAESEDGEAASDADENASDDVTQEQNNEEGNVAEDESATADSFGLGFLQRTLYLHEWRDATGISTRAGTPEMTLTFAGADVSGNAGCNNFGGSFSVTDDALTLSRLAATRKACEEEIMQAEGRFLLALESVSTYELDNGALLLNHPLGTLVFRPVPAVMDRGGDEAQADEENQNAADEALLAPVDSFDIVLDGSSATLTVRGTFSDGCGAVGFVEQDLTEENSVLRVTVEMAPPDPAQACMMVLTPYEHTVALDIAGLLAGDYRVVVNGIEGSLTLNSDIPAE